MGLVELTVNEKYDISSFAKVGTCEGQKICDGIAFPYVLNPSKDGMTLDDVCVGIKEHQTHLQSILLKHGAILFRGFPTKTAETFNTFVESWPYAELPYVGGAAPRTIVCNRVFTTNESPPDAPIPFHHEMAQVPKHPHQVFFMCVRPPTTGGETPLLPSWFIYNSVKSKYPEFVDELEEKQLIYTRVMPKNTDPTSPIGRGWIDTYGSEEKKIVEEANEQLGNSIEWLENGDAKVISKSLPGIKEDSRTGRKVWFNSMVAAYTGWIDSRNDPKKAVTFGDGKQLPDAILLDIDTIMHDLAVHIKWTNADIYVIDNRQTMHARNPYSGPRRVLASLAQDPGFYEAEEKQKMSEELKAN